MTERLLPPRGGYRKLLSYRKAVIVYDATVCFCDRFLPKFDRTRDQMIQAARSGKQNIVEGSMASRASTETEIKLTNVARASLEELLEDYQDYLRNNNRRIWKKESKEAQYVRQLGANPLCSIETFRPYYQSRPGPVVANILICLLHQTNYLLDRQVRRLERDFLLTGGLRERMTRARLNSRKRKS